MARAAFALNFSSAGKGPFIAGKAKNMGALSWGGDSRVKDIASTSL